MINVQVTKKIIQIRMENNRERGFGIHVCLGSGEWAGGSYNSITFNWINLEYVFIAAFDYKSWQRTWHTFGTDIYKKWHLICAIYKLRDT